VNSLGHPAAAVVEDVITGKILVSASADARGVPGPRLKPTSLIRPLSAIKVFAAASWWEHDAGARRFACDTTAESIEDILVFGCDGSGKRLAVALRKRIGSRAVLSDLSRFGFEALSHRVGIVPPDDTAGVQVASTTKNVPVISLSPDADDSTWARALSVGETDVATTLIGLAHFWQAIGNEGIAVDDLGRRHRLFSAGTAIRLQRAMLRCVREGTAKSLAESMAGTGWSLGGKTGTGPGVDRAQSGGLFAGLLFDPAKRARYAIIVLVEGAGPGGGVAAHTAADIARLLSGA
jgi:hypothetical protein